MTDNILPLISLLLGGVGAAIGWFMRDRKVQQLEHEKMDIENDKLKAEAAVATVDSVKTVMAEFHNMTTRFIQLQNKNEELLEKDRQRDLKDRAQEGMLGGLQDQIDLLEKDLSTKATIYHEQQGRTNLRLTTAEKRANDLVDDFVLERKARMELEAKHRDCETWKLLHMEEHHHGDNYHSPKALYPA